MLTCGQEVTSAVIIVISTLYYFHMKLFLLFFSFLCTTSSQCDEGGKRKHTDDSNVMVCRGQWRFWGGPTGASASVTLSPDSPVDPPNEESASIIK